MLVRAGKLITTTAAELGMSQPCLHNWVRQDQVNRGELPGVTTSESAELRRAMKQIRQLKREGEILTKASQFLAKDKPPAPLPKRKRIHPVIDRLVDAGLPPKVCCRIFGLSSPGSCRHWQRPLSRTQLRRQWRAGLIREVHGASRRTYGARPVHAELTLGMGTQVSETASRLK